MKDIVEEGKTNSLGAGNDEDEGGEGGDAQHQEDLVPQPAQLPQAGVLPVQHLISALFLSPSWICSLLNKDRYDIQILKIMHYLVHMAKIIGSQLIK